MSGSNVKMKWRMFAIMAICISILAALILRTGYLQIVRGHALQQMAADQQTRDRVINSRRGDILDRNGKVVAVSANVEMITAAPVELENNKKNIPIEKVAQELSTILELDYEETLKKITTKTSYVEIKRKVEKEAADRVRGFIADNKVKGVRLDSDTKRFYPYGNFAAHVIGCTGADNQGLFGIEMVYDKYLKGSPGRVVSAKNAAGIEMPFAYEQMVDPQDGMNVVLTIDESIQRFVEKHLKTATVDNAVANGAACIVMDVKSGDILAMATEPEFDLNQAFTLQSPKSLDAVAQAKAEEKNQVYSNELQKMWRNKAVADTYEPGSTFKIFTASMALEENAINPETDHFTCGGSRQVADYNIRCWKAGGHGTQTFLQAIQNSCNPAFIDIGLRVGTEKFRQYYKGFGFMEKTGLTLPGEAIGPFHPASNFHEIQLATSAFGQSFQITPLQMITGVCGVANGGKMMRPKIVKQLTDRQGNVVQEFPDEFIRQTVSEKTSKIMCQTLESVIAHGSGSGAYIKGYRIAGKTGTSEKLPRGNGKYVSSFVAFAPADDPKIAILLLLDEPTGGAYFGGIIATPVVRGIMEDALPYLNIQPAYTPEEQATLETMVPYVKGMTVAEAKKQMATYNLKCTIQGSGTHIESVVPKPGIKVNQQSTVVLYTTSEEARVAVPNVVGQPVNSARDLLQGSQLNIVVEGVGAGGETGGFEASKQEPAAGTMVSLGTTVKVEFRRLEVGE